MSNRKYVVNKERLPEVIDRDETVLEAEIEYTLRGLDKIYKRNMTIFDDYQKFLENTETLMENVSKKHRR